MNLLLDTCAILAVANGTLSARAARAVRSTPEVFVSSVSAWEIAIKAASGKLTLPHPAAVWFESVLERYRILEIPLDHGQACEAAALPQLHKDPFDRVLVALANSRSLRLVTNDRIVPQYPNLEILW